MKKLLYTFLAAATLSSCSKYLDQVPDDRLTIEETFRTWNTASQFLADVYRRVPDEYGQRNPGGDNNAGLWTGGSDEADFVWGFVQSNSTNIGNWDANSGFVGDYWRNFYRGIRAASVFMENADKITDLAPNLITRYKAEARALRAMYYFYLMRIYGPVVILPEQAPPVEANLQLPRNSIDECVAYIASELEKAAPDLPVTIEQEENRGHLTKGVALAFRANAMMYAASPLYNGNTDFALLKNKDGKVLVSQTFDANKWRTAANAYKAFLTEFDQTVYKLYIIRDAQGNIDPYLSYRQTFLDDWNSETILGRVGNSIDPRGYEMTPYHSGAPSQDLRGSGGLGATQNMVDAYFMKNGRSITDPQSQYVTTGFTDYQAPGDTKARSTYNQWVNREPRFYASITYNGSAWLNRQYGEIVSTFYYSGNSGRKAGGGDYTTTGYVVRKAAGTGKWQGARRVLPLVRLAEIYLSYAECLNEAGFGDPDVLKYLNLIRQRAGIPQYGTPELPAPATQEDMRQAIRRERRVELAFENSRYFDVRRWKIAETTENGPIYGLDINAELPAFYNVVAFENRVFAKRHYLFPIPSNDVNNDRELIQNPGW